MKKFIGISILVLLAGFSQVNAQSTTSKVGTDVKDGAVKAGNKTAEVASKGKAAVTDQVYKDKVGPNGETIYIDKHSKYYWIDKKGHKVPIEKDKLIIKK
ncbi:hypothetical protein A4H97_24610 [Niastella yeongjuensis]|uniref:PBCV-specific basic adaptor domain-containing protein n=1 Tax=Niastella yeongjuensis TaxID=354355 RepID=A0A1V9F3C0_9BACT|nr:hypothetical protein [Niastella yeongjuensis]OQP52879.1 hypothetical protein A4H97_24610 [Niastella yeongjuensis]SEP21661.1 hypothetical protein SAMN05660816_04812 [Niastella yeongjuensis]